MLNYGFTWNNSDKVGFRNIRMSDIVSHETLFGTKSRIGQVDAVTGVPVMYKKTMFCIVLIFVATGLIGLAGERSFSWTHAPAASDSIGVNLNSYSLGKYLAQCQVNLPEIVNEAKTLLDRGTHYRKRVRDQKNNPTILTIYVDSDYMLHIITNRKEDCPVCGGTGSKKMPFSDKAIISAGISCYECKGEGKLPNHTIEKYFVLSSEDFENAEQGRAIMADKAYSNAPTGAEQWVEKLASGNPRDRLAACLWLDENYVRKGSFFQDIMPMLKKARYYDSNEKKKIMVWQFWAGKDLSGESKRAYYRIYADTKTGKITEKGFYAGR